MKPRMFPGKPIFKLLESRISNWYLYYSSPKHPVVHLVHQPDLPPGPVPPPQLLWVLAAETSQLVPFLMESPSALWSLHWHPQKEVENLKLCWRAKADPWLSHVSLCLFSRPVDHLHHSPTLGITCSRKPSKITFPPVSMPSAAPCILGFLFHLQLSNHGFVSLMN